MDIAGRSHKGFIRVSNQDNYLITQNSQGDTLAIVCDGIGGAKAGDVASLMATKFIGESFANIEGFDSISEGEAWFKDVIKKANDKIFTATATSDDYAGMGTTLVGALIVNNELIVANVGDSRAYVLYKDVLRQVTLDHSLVYELLASGKISEADLDTHPQRNILTNALGVVGQLKIAIFKVTEGEKLLLCTDGLSGYVSSEVILSIINNLDYTVDTMLEKLINKANDAGGYDNTTIIIADIGGLMDE